MIAKTFRALLIAALFAVAVPTHAQLTFKDDLNRALILKAPAKRIVTLSPSLTELVYAAGAGDLVVGVDSLSDYPPEARKVAQVPTGDKFTIEAIAAIKPDLVFAWREGIRRDDIERITAFGATVFVAQARNLSDIPRLLEIVGRMTARDTTPQVSDFELRLEAVRRANAGKPRMSAFLEIWNRPLTTISGNHILSEALEVCRAENVFRELPGSAPKVSWDDVAREDPYVIVGAGSASSVEEFKSNWQIRAGLSAVRADRLVYLESDAIQRPTPRTPEGIAQLCAVLDEVRNPATAKAKTIPATRPTSTAGAASAPGASAAAAAMLKPAASPAPTKSPTPSGTIPPASAPTAAAPETAVPAAPPAASAEAADQKPRRPSQYGM